MTTPQRWAAPAFIEIRMDAEIGSYQEDDDRSPGEIAFRSKPRGGLSSLTLAAITAAAVAACGNARSQSASQSSASTPVPADAPEGGTIAPAPVADGGAVSVTGKGASVLEHQNGPTRNGRYVDPLLTKARAATMKRDATFNPTIHGMVRAQPLFVDASTGGRGEDMILVATEQNFVHAIDAGGATIWSEQLAAPVPRSALACGNIDPFGVTGTPVIDLTSRTMYLAALTTPDGGKTKKQLLFAVDVDDGSVRPGWPVDVSAAVSGFDSSVQEQRSALALVGGNLFVPYGGILDCGSYHGWVISVRTADPSRVQAWATDARGGSSWAVGGAASDGTSVYVATGNTVGATTWGGGEAVIRFDASTGASFSGATEDFFAPADWQALDSGDKDLGSSSPLILDVPGATPPRVVLQWGKPTTAYLLDPANLGGIGPGFAHADGVAGGETATAPASYTTPKGTFVVANAPCPGGGTITALKVSATSPPKLSAAWCADQHGAGVVAVSTTDGTNDAIVWGLGTTGDNNAAGDQRLHAFDGETGAVVYGGGGANDVMNHLGRFMSPMIAKGAIYVGAQNKLHRFR
jgi:hypothetical protein